MKTQIFSSCIVFSLIISCSDKKDESKKKETDQQESLAENPDSLNEMNIRKEKMAVSLIDTLPEVVSLANMIDSTTQSKNHLSIWVAADPSETKIKYYWVKVGEDNGENLVTLHHFYVDPDHSEILYYDVVNDTLITLEEWRTTFSQAK